MRSLIRLGVATAVVLVLAAGGLTLAKGGPFGVSAPVDADVDAKRAAFDQRVSDARHAGKLRGLGYMSLLDEQHRLLVRQKRAEANGMPASDKQQLLDDIARANATLDRQLGK